ncbi:MAG: carbohydrate-binding family 9-like protein [Clostridia bacterium]
MLNNLEISSTKNIVFLKNNIDGNEALEQTRVSCWRDNDSLYFEFCCDTSAEGYTSFGKNYNDKLWMGNVVEVFITLGDKKKYIEIETNPNGVNYAVKVDNKDGVGDFELTFLEEGQYLSMVAVNGKEWTTWIAMPIEKLEKLGFDKNNAFINMYRQSYIDQNEPNLYAYSPTMLPKFHICDAFAKLEIK